MTLWKALSPAIYKKNKGKRKCILWFEKNNKTVIIHTDNIVYRQKPQKAVKSEFQMNLTSSSKMKPVYN
jgi:hypothetical protein